MTFWETLCIALIPAAISAFVSIWTAHKSLKTGIHQLQVSNQHDIDRLMEQHKVDIESIREQHRLDMEAKDKDHSHQLEVMQRQHENELHQKEQETLNGLMSNALGGVITGALNSPSVRREIDSQVIKAIKKSK